MKLGLIHRERERRESRKRRGMKKKMKRRKRQRKEERREGRAEMGRKEGLREQRSGSACLFLADKTHGSFHAFFFLYFSWLEFPRPAQKFYSALLQHFHLPFGYYQRLKPTQQGRVKLGYLQDSCLVLKGIFFPCPTSTDEKEDGCSTKGVGDACKLGSVWAGWAGEGFLLTHMHTWIQVPRWQPDKLLPCPHLPSHLFWRRCRAGIS